MITGSTVLDDYLTYLRVIKGRSEYTIAEYRVDIRLLFLHVYQLRFNKQNTDCSFADIEFIKSITINDVYSFIRYCQEGRKCTIQTCGRKIIAIRQFWLHTSATLLYRYGKVDLNALREILGHVSLSTTQIYLHSDPQQLQSAMNSNPLSSMINRSQR